MKHYLLTASIPLVMAAASNAALVSQFGILDLNANGGINPNTGNPWQAGDTYRLAFYTDGGIDAQSDDPAVYDAFATAQAQLNSNLSSSTGWTAMVWVNTDASLPQAADLNDIQAGESPISNPAVRGGYADTTGGSGIGGAGSPVFAMDGATAIARNNEDLLNNWSNPFASDTTIRLAANTTNLNSDGDPIVASQSVNYAPFLDQFGLGDSANIHGASVWTGGWRGPVNPLGNSVDPNGQTRGSWGSSNANNAGRTWNRFQDGTTSSLSVYALSPELVVADVIPEPSTSLLAGLASLGLLIRRRK